MKMIPNGDEMLVCYRILEFTLILIHWKWTTNKQQTRIGCNVIQQGPVQRSNLHTRLPQVSGCRRFLRKIHILHGLNCQILSSSTTEIASGDKCSRLVLTGRWDGADYKLWCGRQTVSAM